MISHSTRHSLVSLHLSQNATGQVSGAVRTFVLRRLNLVRIIDLIYSHLFVLEELATLIGIVLSPFDPLITRL